MHNSLRTKKEKSSKDDKQENHYLTKYNQKPELALLKDNEWQDQLYISCRKTLDKKLSYKMEKQNPKWRFIQDNYIILHGLSSAKNVISKTKTSREKLLLDKPIHK